MTRYGRFPMRFGVMALSVVLLAGIFGGACLASSNQPTFGGVLRVGIEGMPPTFDTMLSGSVLTRMIMAHVTECLVTYDEGSAIVPDLALSWTVSADGLVFTFALRHGVLFHNGKEMTAEDAKASMERYQRVGRRSTDLKLITEITVVDPYTLKIVVSKAINLLNLMASPSAPMIVMPKEIAAKTTDLAQADLIGTGPYKFVESIPDVHIKLIRFDAYVPHLDSLTSVGTDGMGGTKIPYLDEIDFIPIPDATARELAVETGQVDMAVFLPASAGAQLEATSGLVAYKELPAMKQVLNFNNAFGLTSNLKIRQAIQACLDAEEILDTASGGVYALDHNILYTNNASSTEEGAELYNQANEAKARQLLQEAGYKGEELVLMTTKSYIEDYRTAQVVAAQLAAIGMNINIQVYDMAAMWGNARQETGWNMFTDLWVSLFDPSWFMAILDSEASPWTHYKNAEMDALLDQLAYTIDPVALREINGQIERKVWDEAIFYPIGDVGGYTAVRSNVNGFVPWRVVRPRLWNVWLDK